MKDPPDYSPLSWPSRLDERDVIVSVVVEVEPIAKGRAYPGKTKEYQAMLAKTFAEHFRNSHHDLDWRFGIRCVFYRSNRQRIDCDNLLKLVSDAATGVVWNDDSQVLETVARVFRFSERPRSEIVIYRVEDTDLGKKACAYCGDEFLVPRSQSKQKFCSTECYGLSKRVWLTCPYCGSRFSVLQCKSSAIKGYCSRSCGLKAAGARKTEARGPHLWRCEDCGGQVSRKEYTRCFECTIKARKLKQAQ